MKKKLVTIMALLLVVAVAMPAFALEVKYGGLFRIRWQSTNNVLDGTDTDTVIPIAPGAVLRGFDDNQNYFDERIRMFFTFISSENLRGVIAFEQDVLWGDSRADFGRILRGHRDTVGLELKHAYLDFAIPNTTVRVRAGVQPIALMTGWVIDEDFTAVTATGKFDPISVTLGYVSERNGQIVAGVDRTGDGLIGIGDQAPRTFGVNTEEENVDDLAVSVNYASGPISAALVGFWQYGHNARSVRESNVRAANAAGGGPGGVPIPLPGDPSNPSPFSPFSAFAPYGDNDHLFDLGFTFSYKQDFWNVTLNFVKNLGSFDRDRFIPNTVLPQARNVDYTGWMIEGVGNYFCGPWSFTLGAFYTSGDDNFSDDEMEAFVYPIGSTHAWSEIMGGGSLDTTINDSAAVGAGDNFGSRTRGNYQTYNAALGGPSNVWAINAGVAYQVLEGTKLTLNYYYAATAEDVVSGVPRLVNGVLVIPEDNSIGHELDFYVDQRIVDKLMLRLVGAYLFAGDAFTILDQDDDAYEVGAVLQWSF